MPLTEFAFHSAMRVDFFDTNGSPLSVDFQSGSGTSAVASAIEAAYAAGVL